MHEHSSNYLFLLFPKIDGLCVFGYFYAFFHFYKADRLIWLREALVKNSLQQQLEQPRLSLPGAWLSGALVVCEKKAFLKGLLRKKLFNAWAGKNVTSALSVCVSSAACAAAPVPLSLARTNSADRLARKAGVIQSAAHNTASLNMTSSYNLDFLPEMMVEGRLLSAGERM